MIARIIGRHTIVLPLLLSGCASTVPPQDTGRVPIAGVTRQFHSTIDLGGRLSVRYQSGGKEEALHGSFIWSQAPARANVTLLSPLGQTMAIIDVSAEGATLKQSGQPSRSADNVDALTADTLGWPLPVAGMRDWLQGFAVDAAGRPFVATPAAPDVTTRDGWRIHYASWQSATSDIPKRIDLERITEQAGNVSIRIVIDTWQTP